MKRTVFLVFGLLFLSACSQSANIGREIRPYWSPGKMPYEMSISITSGGVLGWKFPEREGDTMSGYTQSILESPYVDQNIKNGMLYLSGQETGAGGETFNIDYTGSVLITQVITSYLGYEYGENAGGISLAGVPDNKTSIFSYPLVRSTDIQYFFQSGTTVFSTGLTWAVESSYAFMHKGDGGFWYSTGMVLGGKKTGPYENAIRTTVSTRITEGEVESIPELRIRIFPKGYDEKKVFPILKIFYFDSDNRGFAEDIDVFFEKDGKSVKEISSNIFDRLEGGRKVKIFNDLQHDEIDTIIIRKR